MGSSGNSSTRAGLADSSTLMGDIQGGVGASSVPVGGRVGVDGAAMLKGVCGIESG